MTVCLFVGARSALLELCTSQMKFCILNHQDSDLAADNLADMLIAINKHGVSGAYKNAGLIRQNLYSFHSLFILFNQCVVIFLEQRRGC